MITEAPYKAAAGILADALRIHAKSEIDARHARHPTMTDHVDGLHAQILGRSIADKMRASMIAGFARQRSLGDGIAVERRLSCVVLTEDQYGELCHALQRMQETIDRLSTLGPVTPG